LFERPAAPAGVHRREIYNDTMSRPSMSPAATLPAEWTPPTVRLRIQPTRGLRGLDLRGLWDFRELLYFLVWRDISIRYKQTAIGAAWTVLQPVLTMLVFTIMFGHFARIPSDGLPYSIFTFAALVPWTYFSQAIARSGVSLVSDSQLVKKVYFPRAIIPVASAAAPLVDFFVSFVVLAVMMVWYGIALRWNVVALPLCIVQLVAIATAVSLWLAPLNARYRDVGYAIPFLTQFWFYASPVTYPLNIVPEKWRLLYALNPVVGIIEEFRWALLGKGTFDFTTAGMSVAITGIALVTGILFFSWMERSLSDIL
jgi:lipopolysaccharide transport system permease protein